MTYQEPTRPSPAKLLERWRNRSERLPAAAPPGTPRETLFPDFEAQICDFEKELTHHLPAELAGAARALFAPLHHLQLGPDFDFKALESTLDKLEEVLEAWLLSGQTRSP